MPTITRLPLDLSGGLPSNLRENEAHPVVAATGKKNRVIVPQFGAFFVDSVTVRDASGVALVRHVNVEYTYHYELFSELTGKGVSALIIITDPNLRAPFTITYQAVGGNFSLSVAELADVIEFAKNNTDKIKWDDIIDKPEAYVPSPHFNKYWQLYGLDSLVTATNRLGDAISVGRKAVVDSLTGYYASYVDEMTALLNAFRSRVNAHITDLQNPHATDKNKLNLGNLYNWKLADYIESIDININNRYQPIGGVYNQLMQTAIPVLNAHIADKAGTNIPDPHHVTLAQLNLYSTAEINTLFNLRLGRDEVAYNSDQLVGINYATVYDTFRSTLAASNVASNARFNQYQLGQMPVNANPTEYTLLGNNTYVKYADLMQVYNDTSGTIFAIGSFPNITAAQLAANTASSSMTAGTWIVANVARQRSILSIYTPCAWKVASPGTANLVLY